MLREPMLKSMNVKDYWTALSQAIDKFDEKIKEKESKELEEYQKLRDVLKQIIKCGSDSQNTYNPATIIKLVTKGEELMYKPPFDANTQTPMLGGPLVNRFIENVYIPHLARFKDVTFSTFQTVTATASGKSIETRKMEALKKIELLHERLERYKKEQESVQKKSEPEQKQNEVSLTSFTVFQPPTSATPPTPEKTLTVSLDTPRP